VISIKLHNKK